MTSSKSAVLVFGTSGQLATALRLFWPEAVFVPREDCDFSKPETALRVLDRVKPRLVINPAAYTQVDQAETDFDLALKINAETPSEIARWCALDRASLIHFSTDYVYDGEGVEPRIEDSKTSPLNRYGASKLAGDEAIAQSGCHHVILRTSWVVSPWGKNFIKTMLKLGAEREVLSVVDDQVGAPTFAEDLARATNKIATHAEFQKHSGVFHFVNGGQTSWFGFAEEIFRFARELEFPLKIKELRPIATEAFPTPARRPKNSRLSTEKLKATFGVTPRPWQEPLKDCLLKIKSANSGTL